MGCRSKKGSTTSRSHTQLDPFASKLTSVHQPFVISRTHPFGDFAGSTEVGVLYYFSTIYIYVVYYLRYIHQLANIRGNYQTRKLRYFIKKNKGWTDKRILVLQVLKQYGVQYMPRVAEWLRRCT